MIHDVGIKTFLSVFIAFVVLAFGASCSSGEANTQKATQNMESPTDSSPLQSDDNSDTSVKSTQETGPDVKESEEESLMQKANLTFKMVPDIHMVIPIISLIRKNFTHLN